MNFFSVRNLTKSFPPLPSSETLTPAARGGRGAESATNDQAASAETPTEARSRLSIVFFLAAMMPLNDG